MSFFFELLQYIKWKYKSEFEKNWRRKTFGDVFHIICAQTHTKKRHDHELNERDDTRSKNNLLYIQLPSHLRQSTIGFLSYWSSFTNHQPCQQSMKWTQKNLPNCKRCRAISNAVRAGRFWFRPIPLSCSFLRQHTQVSHACFFFSYAINCSRLWRCKTWLGFSQAWNPILL